jgi:hypothetical protein
VTAAAQALPRWAMTDAAGRYRVAELPPARYTVRCSADRFSEVAAPAVVTVDSHVRVDFRLPLAGLDQSITVKATVGPLQSDSAELGGIIDRASIANLPLNRRDFLQLAMLAPGVAPPVEDSELSTRGNFAMHVNGGREEFNNFLLDGVDNNDQDTNRYVLQPSVDAIQEFKIATNAYSAEYGRSGAGQINVVTRGGGSQWHGFGYEYLRNRVLDARNFFDGAENPKYIRNQFGGGGGGPVVRDRTFAFASFDGLRERQSLSRIASVPTAAQRDGDLSALAPVRDPFSGAPFAGNRIPAARISPVARKVLNLYPNPNLPGLAANLLAQPVGRDSQSQANARLDHRLGAADQITLRYSYGYKDLFEPFTEDPTGIPGFGDFLLDRGHNALAHWTHAGSGGLVNSVLVGFNRGVRRLVGENYTTDANQVWGVNYLPTRPLDFGYPSVNVAGFSRAGDVTSLPIVRAANTYQVNETLAIGRGTHGLKMGGEVRHVQHNGAVQVLSRGALSFFGALSGAGVGDLLLGLPTLALQARADNPQTLRTSALNAFVQDDWRIRSNLTLNLGLRYEYNTPPVDPNDRMAIYNAATGTVARVGTNGASRSGLRPDRTNFAPRLGVAWTPSPGLVVRGGYGLSYDAGMFIVNSALYFNPPYFNMRVFTPSAAGLLFLADPFPVRGGFTPPPSLNTLNPDVTTAYLQSWNLTVEKDLQRRGVFGLSYAGSKGTHLVRSRDLNQPRPASGDLQGRLNNPNFGNILSVESAASSNYHSLQAQYRRPMGAGWSALAIYTLAKSIDDTSAFLGTKADRNFPQDSGNFHAERALSSFDVHQRAAAALVYHVPGSVRWLRGTEASAMVAAQSGQPFTPILSKDNSNTGNTGGNFGSDRPNLWRNPVLAQRSPQRWFDTGAFAVPAPYTFGAAGRNVVRGPAYFTMDASLGRRFAVGDRAAFVAQLQGFNLLNRANFDLPERVVDNPANFGRIFSAKAPRQVQVALRLEF